MAQQIAEHNKKLILQTREALQIYQWCMYHKDTSAYKKQKIVHTVNMKTEDENQEPNHTALSYVRDQDYLTRSAEERALVQIGVEPREQELALSITSDEFEKQPPRPNPMQQPFRTSPRRNLQHQDHGQEGGDQQDLAQAHHHVDSHARPPHEELYP
jgi:hypothetical protein